MPLSVAYKELLPVVVAAALGVLSGPSQRVEFCSDNMAVVEVLQSGTSRDPQLNGPSALPISWQHSIVFLSQLPMWQEN